MKNKCTEIRSILKEYLENRLERDRQEQVELHLEECADCQVEMKLERDLLALFENAPRQICPQPLIDSLQDIPGDNRIPISIQNVKVWRRAGAAVAAVAALMLLTFWLVDPVPGPGANHHELEQQQIAGQLRWSLAVTANYLMAARELVETEYSTESILVIINSAVGKGAESQFLKLRPERNGG
jgi:hypothetical protein